MTILAAKQWRTNADMMVDVAALYIKPDAVVYDPTYGKGGFWKKVRPKNLLFDDINPEKGYGGDFRDMPHADNTFDVVVFDPAYVTPGGRDTSSIQVMNAAYGMDTTKVTLAEQWDDIKKGMSECVRVLRPSTPKDRAYFMQKCMNYISSGDYHDYLFDVKMEMKRLGLTIVDTFYFVRASGGPQDKNRTKECPDCQGSGNDVAEIEDDVFIECGCEHCSGSGRVPVEQVHASNNISFLVVGQK